MNSEEYLKAVNEVYNWTKDISYECKFNIWLHYDEVEVILSKSSKSCLVNFNYWYDTWDPDSCVHDTPVKTAFTIRISEEEVKTREGFDNAYKRFLRKLQKHGWYETGQRDKEGNPPV